MSASRDRALSLLGSGLNNEVVATTMGVDPSYISQLMTEDAFKEEVIRLRTLSLTANSERDHKLDSIEDKLLIKLDESLDYLINPDKLLRAYAVVNNAKRRGVPVQQQTIVNNTIVNLQIPQHVMREFVQNASGNVVEVDQRPMITMQAKTLLANLTKTRGKDGSIYHDINKRIPELYEAESSS